MKRMMAVVLSMALLGSVIAAQAQEGAATATTAKSAGKKAGAKMSGPAVSEQLSEMKQAIEAQQQQIRQLTDLIQSRDQKIQQLEQRLDQGQAATAQAQTKADTAAALTAEQGQTVASIKSDVTDLKTSATNSALTLQEAQKDSKSLGDRIKALDQLKFSGDLRLRYEPFFGGGPADGPSSPQRNRQRYRLRFNVNTKVAEDFAVGFSLASGDLGDPISTNSTLTGFYTRKPIAIDKAFGVYNPHKFKPFTLTAGKFAYPWLRTELTWDNDLNPEGASAAVAWNWKGKFINHLALITYGTTVLEVGGGPDSYMEGGQIQTGWNLFPKVKLTADAAYYDFANADTIAQNQTGGNGLATSGTTTTGGGTFGFGGSTNTNNFGVIDGKRVYASKFGIFDAIARLDFDTGAKRWPIYALINFAQNTRACSNLQAFVVAEVEPPACDPHQRHGYWTELKFGQTKNKGDVLFGYTFARIERDAVLAAFNFSDLRQPTNVIEHRIEASYQAYPHVQIGFTGLIGRQIVTEQSPTLENWLKRFQFDTIFSF